MNLADKQEGLVMNGVIEAGFGLAFGLAFAYLANNAVTTARAIRALPVAWYKKVLVFVAHNYLLMTGMFAGLVLVEFYAVWQMGYPDGSIFFGRILDGFLNGRTSKLLLGFYLAAVLVVVYFRNREHRAAKN